MTWVHSHRKRATSGSATRWLAAGGAVVLAATAMQALSVAGAAAAASPAPTGARAWGFNKYGQLGGSGPVSAVSLALVRQTQP
jgi:hypothetical protein